MNSALSVCLLACCLAAVLARLEWHRPDRCRLPARLTATLGAVAALASLALSPSPLPTLPPTAILLTPGATPFPPPPSSSVIRHLPAAVSQTRLSFPLPSSLHIYGSGLDPAELPALADQRIIYHPPAAANSGLPAIQFLHCPRELPLGQPLDVQGQVTGLLSGQTTRLTLTAPDGTLTEALTTPGDAQGSAAFTLHSPCLPAPGYYLWQLRLGGPAPTPQPATRNPQPPPPSSFSALPLGITITLPILPRVLILESSPRFDTAALRRWYEASGGALLVRTQLGQDRFRLASAQGTPPAALPSLTAPLLAGFDLLLADPPALLALRPEERATLLTAVRDTGLSLLALADESTLLPPPPELAELLPWTLAPAADLPPSSPPPSAFVIQHLPAAASQARLSLSAPPSSLIPHPSSLASSPQGRLLAASVPAGRGQLALTLVTDTSRWPREGDPAAFAGYWSHLFTRLARPAAPTGHWTLLDGDAGPVFADHPLTLRWTGPADRAPAAARVTAEGVPAASPATLALAPDPLEPAARLGTFWPRRPGWHRAAADAAPGTPGLDFYVHAAADWPALDAARRRTATARFAGLSAAPPASHALGPNRALSPGWAIAFFFLCASYLWTERRLASEGRPKVQSTRSKEGSRSKVQSPNRRP